VEADLAAEGKAMEEYTAFCDDELKEKAYAIETAGRSIDDLSATIEAADAQITGLDDEIPTLGSLISQKSSESMEASKERKSEHKDFVVAEKELIKSVDQLTRAGTLLKKGLSFAQIRGGKKKLVEAVNALSVIVTSQWLDISSKKRLQSFIQAHSSEDDDDSFGGRFENKHKQPQAKMVAYESGSGSHQIVEAIEEMQGKAEDTLSELRKKEMSDQHAFENVAQTLDNEISHAQEKLATAKASKSANEESMGTAQAELVETKKSKAADEEYSKTLKGECEAKATEWEARLKSAQEEMAAIDKAKEILVSGVKAFVQVSATTRRMKSDEDEDDAQEAREEAVRNRVVRVLKKLATRTHSFKLVQVASMAASDPFVKIRGLIEDMIAKLVKEAEEDATHEAFCQEEMSKSSKAQEDKQMKVDKYKVRIDKAATEIATLTEEVKTLEAEVAEIDKAQAEATEIRNTENTEYLKASKDFKDSAEAVAKAIEVLKNFYEGSFIQISAKTTLKSKQPEFGGSKGDTAHTILAVLEMSEEDFTTLLAETEETESEAAKKYKALSDENKIAKSTKLADAKSKESNIKSLKVSLEHHREDHASVSEELAAVNAYIEKLKPECESKAMSYEEKKAAREAEIEGLKEALGILEGSIALVQTGRFLH